MTELEKLDAGLPYDFWDKEVNARKLRAIHLCARLNAMPQDDEPDREPLIRELFAGAGDDPSVGPNFSCDYGLHITVGKNFLANYNVTILDIAPVTIGDYVMIGPNVLISTVGHRQQRRSRGRGGRHKRRPGQLRRGRRPGPGDQTAGKRRRGALIHRTPRADIDFLCLFESSVICFLNEHP